MYRRFDILFLADTRDSFPDLVYNNDGISFMIFWYGFTFMTTATATMAMALGSSSILWHGSIDGKCDVAFGGETVYYVPGANRWMNDLGNAE